MAMAIQSNFRFKAMLDLFGRLAMQPKGTLWRCRTIPRLDYRAFTSLFSFINSNQLKRGRRSVQGRSVFIFSKCICSKFKASTWLMSLLVGSVTKKPRCRNKNNLLLLRPIAMLLLMQRNRYSNKKISKRAKCACRRQVAHFKS